MSFLNPVRITFAGRFQADVSTVNNDVRHYDDAHFVPDFQDLQKTTVVDGKKTTSMNGWWNPTGSGAFRFVGCNVTSVGLADGAVLTDPASDGAIGAAITGAADRSAGKLVDIDPQWQLASAPWGLGVRLVADGVELLRGEYTSYGFRDLWFSRLVGSSQDGAASSTFQAVLTGVVFDPAGLERSAALRAMQAATVGDRLSIRLTTFGYDGGATSPTFTLGTMLGTIGPALEGEPESYVLGRRFAPASGFSSYGAGITYFSGVVDHASQTLLLDLSNALQITDGDGTVNDLGALSVGVLADESIMENTPVTADNFTRLAAVDYAQKGWLATTAGVVAIPLDDSQLTLVDSLPLALVYDTPFNPGAAGQGDGLGIVAIRETIGGLFVGAEPAVIRLDPGDSITLGLRATRYGAAIDGDEIQLRQLGRVPGQGGGPPDPQVDPIPIPDIGFPESALTVPGTAPLASGSAEVTLCAAAPGNPRTYLDGQLYLIDYRLPGQGNASRQPFDFVVVHVRDAYDVPDHPEWERDVLPILTQFGNLYPVMSRGFINLSDEAQVTANRDLLALSFSRPMTDPNHMPVTRDLSAAKREMLQKYLASLPRDVVGGDQPATGPGRPQRSAPATVPTADANGPDRSDSKTRFAAQFLAAGRPGRGASAEGAPS